MGTAKEVANQEGVKHLIAMRETSANYTFWLIVVSANSMTKSPRDLIGIELPPHLIIGSEIHLRPKFWSRS